MDDYLSADIIFLSNNLSKMFDKNYNLTDIKQKLIDKSRFCAKNIILFFNLDEKSTYRVYRAYEIFIISLIDLYSERIVNPNIICKNKFLDLCNLFKYDIIIIFNNCEHGINNIIYYCILIPLTILFFVLFLIFIILAFLPDPTPKVYKRKKVRYVNVDNVDNNIDTPAPPL